MVTHEKRHRSYSWQMTLRLRLSELLCPHTAQNIKNCCVTILKKNPVSIFCTKHYEPINCPEKSKNMAGTQFTELFNIPRRICFLHFNVYFLDTCIIVVSSFRLSVISGSSVHECFTTTKWARKCLVTYKNIFHW